MNLTIHRGSDNFHNCKHLTKELDTEHLAVQQSRSIYEPSNRNQFHNLANLNTVSPPSTYFLKPQLLVQSTSNRNSNKLLLCFSKTNFAKRTQAIQQLNSKINPDQLKQQNLKQLQQNKQSQQINSKRKTITVLSPNLQVENNSEAKCQNQEGAKTVIHSKNTQIFLKPKKDYLIDFFVALNQCKSMRATAQDASNSKKSSLFSNTRKVTKRKSNKNTSNKSQCGSSNTKLFPATLSCNVNKNGGQTDIHCNNNENGKESNSLQANYPRTQQNQGNDDNNYFINSMQVRRSQHNLKSNFGLSYSTNTNLKSIIQNQCDIYQDGSENSNVNSNNLRHDTTANNKNNSNDINDNTPTQLALQRSKLYHKTKKIVLGSDITSYKGINLDELQQEYAKTQRDGSHLNSVSAHTSQKHMQLDPKNEKYLNILNQEQFLNSQYNTSWSKINTARALDNDTLKKEDLLLKQYRNMNSNGPSNQNKNKGRGGNTIKEIAKTCSTANQKQNRTPNPFSMAQPQIELQKLSQYESSSTQNVHEKIKINLPLKIVLGNEESLLSIQKASLKAKQQDFKSVQWARQNSSQCRLINEDKSVACQTTFNANKKSNKLFLDNLHGWDDDAQGIENDEYYLI